MLKIIRQSLPDETANFAESANSAELENIIILAHFGYYKA
jgi:hypothetical protein